MNEILYGAFSLFVAVLWLCFVVGYAVKSAEIDRLTRELVEARRERDNAQLAYEAMRDHRALKEKP